MEVEDDGLIPINTMRKIFPCLLGAVVGIWIGGYIHSVILEKHGDRIEAIEKQLNETAQHSTSDASNKP